MSTLREKIAVMQAFEDGLQIECCVRPASKGKWLVVSSSCWNWRDWDYRIAPGQQGENGDCDDEDADDDDDMDFQCDINSTIAHLKSIQTRAVAERIFGNMRVEDFKFLYSWMKEYAFQVSDKLLN
jgi:hypothetical protein